MYQQLIAVCWDFLGDVFLTPSRLPPVPALHSALACFFCCGVARTLSLLRSSLQELLKDSIQVLRQKCDSMIAEVEAFESGVDFDEAMP